MNLHTEIRAESIALSLDFDGVLVPIASHPDAIEVPGDLTHTLADLTTVLPDRLIIVSGRSIFELQQFLPGLSIPMYGSHGAELVMEKDTVQLAQRPPTIDAIQAEAAAFCEAHRALYLEKKPLGFAIHYRADPSLGPKVETFLKQQLARVESDVILQPAKCAFELKPAGASKGAALEDAIERFNWQNFCPVHIGDDATDEHAFSASERMGGFGVKVGEGESGARFRLPNPQAVLTALRKLRDDKVICFSQ